MEVFKQFIMNRYSGLDALSDDQVKEQIGELSPGCFVLALELASGNVEALALHKCNKAISTMITKENLFSLHVRFLTTEERE